MKAETKTTEKFLTPHEAKRHGGNKPASKPAAKTNKPKTKAKVNGATHKGKLGSLLGHSVISIMRAMGKHGWKFEDAKAALAKAKIPAAETTIRRALKRGERGDTERRIAPVSAKELATLKAGTAKTKATNVA